MLQRPYPAKRRRDTDSTGDVDETIRRGGKRIKSLPIRSPPPYKQCSFLSLAYPASLQSVPALLTPAESSDDDIALNDLNFKPSHLPPLAESNTSSNSSTSSVKVVVGDDGDMEMVDSQPREFVSPRPWQRQRSNDMLAPPNVPHLLDTQHRQGSERLPTPIYGHFNGSDVNMDLNAISARSSTLLSPFIREEEEAPWWRGHRLPSPTDTFDELTTPTTQADWTIGRSNVDTAGSNATTRNKAPLLVLPSQGHPDLEGACGSFGGEFEVPRSRRLVMGVQGDCDKCRRKVPGHYSHIVYV